VPENGVPVEIIHRQLGYFDRGDPVYGAGVAKALGINFRPRTSPAQ
jgi:catalase